VAVTVRMQTGYLIIRFLTMPCSSHLHTGVPGSHVDY
jgi:hypothetical protein